MASRLPFAPSRSSGMAIVTACVAATAAFGSGVQFERVSSLGKVRRNGNIRTRSIDVVFRFGHLVTVNLVAVQRDNHKRKRTWYWETQSVRISSREIFSEGKPTEPIGEIFDYSALCTRLFPLRTAT